MAAAAGQLTDSVAYGQTTRARNTFPRLIVRVLLIYLPIIIYPRCKDISPTSAYDI